MDALEYGLIDEIIAPNEDKERKAISYWARSGRAESDGRLEQWQEYLALQEEYALKDAFKKTQGQVGRSLRLIFTQSFMYLQKDVLKNTLGAKWHR